MKKAFLFFTLLLLGYKSFGQIAGTYYFMGTNGKGEISIEEAENKTLKFNFLEKNYIVFSVSSKEYQDEDNRCQLKIRDDNDIEVLIIDDKSIIKQVYLLSKNKAEIKDRWKKIKGEASTKIDGKAENLDQKDRTYFFLTKWNTEQYQLSEKYTGKDIVRFKFGNLRRGDIGESSKKISENTYIYSSELGSFEVTFLRFFPDENKLIVYRNPHREESEPIICQLSKPVEPNESDKKKCSVFLNDIKTYFEKSAGVFLRNINTYSANDIPVAKINALVKSNFEDKYTILKTKIITSGWKLDRNELGRVLKRTREILVYLKDKKTGKCYFAFRLIGQDFDGKSYGELTTYKEQNFIRLENDNVLVYRYYFLSEYDIPCTELSK